MEHTFARGRLNVHYLHAPYDLLVKAFGGDGTVASRDTYKSMARWDVRTPHGPVEVYDYTCYNGDDGLERHAITHWHVQGSDDAIAHMLKLVDVASKPENVDRGTTVNTTPDTTTTTTPGEYVFQVTLNNGTVKRIRGDRTEMGAVHTTVSLYKGNGDTPRVVYTVRSEAVFDVTRLDAEVSVFTPDAEDTEDTEDTEEELARLRDKVAVLETGSARLYALDAAGVDSWEGYGEAMQIMRDMESSAS